MKTGSVILFELLCVINFQYFLGKKYNYLIYPMQIESNLSFREKD